MSLHSPTCHGHIHAQNIYTYGHIFMYPMYAACIHVAMQFQVLLCHQSSPNHSAGHPVGSLEASQKTCWKRWLKKSFFDIVGRRCFWQFHGILALLALPEQTTGSVGSLRWSDMVRHGPVCTAPCVAHDGFVWNP